MLQRGNKRLAWTRHWSRATSVSERSEPGTRRPWYSNGSPAAVSQTRPLADRLLQSESPQRGGAYTRPTKGSRVRLTGDICG